MLTPFLAYLLEHASTFEECAKNSANRDQSYVWGWGRDKVLSTKQQENAKAMAHFLKSIDWKQTDESTYQAVKNQLTTLTNNTRADVTTHKGATYTTQLLLEFDLFLTRLEVSYDYFRQNNLLNKKFKESPLNIFRSCLVFYLTNKAVHQRKSLINYYYWTGTIRDALYDEKLSTKKEILAKEYLTKDYPDTSVSGVRGQVALLLKEDQALVDSTTPTVTVPVGYALLSASAIFNFSLNTRNLTETANTAFAMLPHAESTQIPILPLARILQEKDRGTEQQPNVSSSTSSSPGDDDTETYYSDDESPGKKSTV